MGNQSTLSINPTSTPPHEPAGLNLGGPVQPSAVQREGGVPPPGPAPIPVEPLQEIPRPPTPTTPVDRGFCDPSALLNYSPRPLDVSYDVRNTSAASTSSRGKHYIKEALVQENHGTPQNRHQTGQRRYGSRENQVAVQPNSPNSGESSTRTGEVSPGVLPTCES